MRSRFLIGAGAWLLGAVTATGGSMVAVSHLANGLLGTGTVQLSPAVVRDDLAGYEHSGSLGGTSLGSDDRSSPAAHRHVKAKVGASPRPRTTPSRSAPSPSLAPASPPAASPGPATPLTSSAGSVEADCQSGLAYLLYWTPYQGYQADDVRRGPAAQASIGFENSTRDVVMRVTCQGSKPVAQLSSDN